MMAIALTSAGCALAVIGCIVALIYIARLHQRIAAISTERRLDRRVRDLARQSFVTTKEH